MSSWMYVKNHMHKWLNLPLPVSSMMSEPVDHSTAKIPPFKYMGDCALIVLPILPDTLILPAGSVLERPTQPRRLMDTAEIDALRELRIHYSIQLVAVVILWYDHMITLPLEISSIWNRPKTLISWIYLVNRYTASLGRIPFFIISWLSLSDKISLVNQHESAEANLNLPGCLLPHASKRLAAARAKASPNNRGVNIPSIVLRDGILYFAGITVCSVLNMVFFYIPPVGSATFQLYPVFDCFLFSRYSKEASQLSTVYVTLVSRMVLNLRDLATPGPEETQFLQQVRSITLVPVAWTDLSFVSHGLVPKDPLVLGEVNDARKAFDLR
ncbi:hypothetical protein HWV62_21944 [Athelia sp. TMB]|nr:hypothetical protein HWV62_21944 [Athelia sp. TMB]